MIENFKSINSSSPIFMRDSCLTAELQYLLGNGSSFQPANVQTNACGRTSDLDALLHKDDSEPAIVNDRNF